VGRDTAVGVATRYGLDRPGIESRWGRGGEIFRTLPDRPWSPSSLLHNGYRVSVPWLKRPARGIIHSPLPSAEVEETVELHTSTLSLGLHEPARGGWSGWNSVYYANNTVWRTKCHTIDCARNTINGMTFRAPHCINILFRNIILESLILEPLNSLQ